MLADARDAPPTLRVLAASNVHIFCKPHRSTRWTGQTCLTNSQVANHERWMVRCSPRTPGFIREQSTQYLNNYLGQLINLKHILNI